MLPPLPGGGSGGWAAALPTPFTVQPAPCGDHPRMLTCEDCACAEVGWSAGKCHTPREMWAEPGYLPHYSKSPALKWCCGCVRVECGDG